MSDAFRGRLFLEFAVHPAGDKRMSWGDVVPEAALTAAHAPFETRARLQADGGRNSWPEQWFAYEGLDAAGCDALAQTIVAAFPQVNAWLRDGLVGPNISAL